MMSTIFRIRHALDSQRLLREVGPMIPASWGVPPENEPTSKTIRPAEQVRGNMLLDTGARHIAIDESVAHQLRLQARPDKDDVHGLGGKQSLAKYNATLFLPVEPVQPAAPAGSSIMIGIPIDAHGFVGLQKTYESQRIKPANGLPVIGILGRTFLQFVRFTYDGLSGNLIIEIDDSVRHPQKT
jgi:hypothetical protein